MRRAVATRPGLSIVAVVAFCCLSLCSARSQEQTGTFPNGVILPLPPVPSLLDDTCVVSVLNRSTQVNRDGSWILPTIPANFGPVRARATCLRNGVAVFGQSDRFTVGTNQAVNLPDITLGNTTPIPSGISINATPTMLTQAGQTTQLTTMATYSDGSRQNISASSTGTLYRTSNASIAVISSEGLVTAVSSGTVLIQALNEGEQGIINIQVVLAGANNGGIPNSWILSNFCPNFSAGTPCPQLTDPAFPAEDPDHDGLTNLQEFQFGTDPNNPDTDGDGLTDGQEVLVYQTNPLLFSTDGTGISDGIEVQTGTIGGTLAAKLAKALQSLEVKPSSFALVVNSLAQQGSQQLSVIGHLIDGKTTIDLTSTQEGTNYSSSDLTVCNFGAPDGAIFAGNAGACTITASNSGFTATASGTVTSFSPTALGSIAIPGFANGVAVNGNYVFVAAGSGGIQVVNATDRTKPTIVATLPLAGNANNIRVVGNLAFVAAGTAGLEIIDVTNPLSPALRSTLNTSGTALDVNIQGNVAYVANSTGLFLANVTNPSTPLQLSLLPLSGLIRGVSVDPAQGIAVVAADTNGVYVVDVSNAGSPALLGQLSTINAHEVAIQGNYAFAADFELLSAPYQNSVASIDISKPLAPTLVSAITNKALGGVQNDLVLAGNLAFGACVSFAPDGIPITDISDPTDLLSRSILRFSPGTDYGMGISIDKSYAYLVADSTTFNRFGSSGNSHLYIGQYQLVQDTSGVPPAVTIVSPTSGSTVVEGATLAVTVNATDDVAVSAVNLLVNGQAIFTDTVAPYVFYYTVPANGSSLTLSATAVDYGGNVGAAPSVVLNVIPDPGTTVTGRVLDGNGNPLVGFVAQAVGYSATTATDGTFSIPNVPSVDGALAVQVSSTVNGFRWAGSSTFVTIVPGGTTAVGDIVAVIQNHYVVVASGEGGSVINAGLTPPILTNILNVSGSVGVSVTPDGSEAIFSSNSGFWFYNLTTNPSSSLGILSYPQGASVESLALTSDSRFAVTQATDSAGQNRPISSINLGSESVVSSLMFHGGAAATTPDNTTVILVDNGSYPATTPPDRQYIILSLSPQGVLSDTGQRVPKSLSGEGNIVVAPNGRFALVANGMQPFGKSSTNAISILRIDANHNVVESSTSIPICCNPYGIAFTPDGTKAYVKAGSPSIGNVNNPSAPPFLYYALAVLNIDANDNVTDSGTRIVIDSGTYFPGGPTSDLGATVPGMAISADGFAYVSNICDGNSGCGDVKYGDTVTLVNTSTDQVAGTIKIVNVTNQLVNAKPVGVSVAH